MKIDWSAQGWRIFPDEAKFAGTTPLRVIQRDIYIIGPVELRLGHDEESNKGWVYVPDDTPLEVLP